MLDILPFGRLALTILSTFKIRNDKFASLGIFSKHEYTTIQILQYLNRNNMNSQFVLQTLLFMMGTKNPFYFQLNLLLSLNLQNKNNSMAEQQTFRQSQQIQTGLSHFLKRVRQREDQHYKLLDYTNKLLMKREKPQQSTASDDISKSREYLKQRLSSDVAHQEKDFMLATKCQSFAFEEQDSLLTRRVGARILQITHNAIETRRQITEYYCTFHHKFKESCLRGLGQVMAKPAWIIRLTNRYLTQKMQVQLQRLRQTTNLLQMSDYQSLIKLKSNYYNQLNRKEMLNVFQKQQIPSVKLSPRKQQSQNPQKQIKTQILLRPKTRSLKEEQKNMLKMKRLEAKKIKKLISSLCQVMDICKDDLQQYLSPQNKGQQTRAMLHQLVNRNRNNQNHINNFRKKEHLYKSTLEKTPLTRNIGSAKMIRYQSLEQELLQKSERLEHEPASAFTMKQVRVSEPLIVRRNDGSHQTRYNPKETTRIVAKTSKIKNKFFQKNAFGNNFQQTDRSKKQKETFTSQKQIQYPQDFVQINLKNAMSLPRARFPQITSRLASVNKSHSIKKEQIVRTKLELKPSNNGNFFQQIQKRISKFCQIKRNLLI